MDYEKEYKAALERCREFYAKLGNKQLKEELEYVFPELAESEDKRMIQYFKDLAPFDKAEELYEKYGFSHKDAIAWLEKKCEQKSVKVPKFKVGDFIQFNGMGHTRYTVKEVCGLSHYINTCNKRMDMSYTDANFELVEQKPTAWSEDDQSNFNELSSFILETYRTEDASRLITWLNNIKDRVQLQPKQEWSEEDKKLINDTCHLINTLASGYGEKVTEPITFSGTQMIASIKDRLSALVDNRPQNTWKPSGEQMDALETAVSSLQSTALESLYNKLKKL